MNLYSVWKGAHFSCNPLSVGKLMQIGAGNKWMNGNLVLLSNPGTQSMSLNYESQGVFSIDGIAGGIALGEMNAKLLQKVEELTLYIISL